MLDQLVQIVGSVIVLAAFAAAQAGRVDPKSLVYVVLNVVGSGVLAVEALLGRQWGFLLLEGVWAAVSLVGLVTLARRRTRGVEAPVVGAAGGPDGAERVDGDA